MNCVGRPARGMGHTASEVSSRAQPPNVAMRSSRFGREHGLGEPSASKGSRMGDLMSAEVPLFGFFAKGRGRTYEATSSSGFYTGISSTDVNTGSPISRARATSWSAPREAPGMRSTASQRLSRRCATGYW